MKATSVHAARICIWFILFLGTQVELADATTRFQGPPEYFQGVWNRPKVWIKCNTPEVEETRAEIRQMYAAAKTNAVRVNLQTEMEYFDAQAAHCPEQSGGLKSR